jgi:hypothetical protein
MKQQLNEVKKLQRLAGLLKENSWTDGEDISEGQYGSDTGAQELYPLMDDLSSLISTNSNLSTADKEAILPILSKMTSIIDAIVADDDFYDDESDDEGPVNDFRQSKNSNDYFDREKNYYGLQEAGAKKRSKKKKNPGLWANIRAQREKGEAPARKGSKAYNSAVKAGKEIKKNK